MYTLYISTCTATESVKSDGSLHSNTVKCYSFCNVYLNEPGWHSINSNQVSSSCIQFQEWRSSLSVPMDGQGERTPATCLSLMSPMIGRNQRSEFSPRTGGISWWRTKRDDFIRKSDEIFCDGSHNLTQYVTLQIIPQI